MITENHTTTTPRNHVVQFYGNDRELVETVGRYLADGLLGGEVVIVVATEDHRLAFAAYLASRGVDVGRARADGLLVELDAADTMARFLIDDQPDPVHFDAVVGGLMRRAVALGRPVRAYGEMVALLWDAGLVNPAVDLEGLWVELGDKVLFSLFCAYPVASMAGAHNHDALEQVCRLHSDVVGTPVQATRTFPRALDSPRAARRFAVETLRAWDRGHLSEDAALVVAELAANAVVHAGTPFTVALSARDDHVVISVSDASTVAPAPREAGSLEQSGRGLHLVAAMSRRWGMEVRADGKVVWVELHG